jgi:hypothetical protein
MQLIERGMVGQAGLRRSVARIAVGTICALLLIGCVSVPPQIAKTHQKELEIIRSLQSSHLAMVDAYVDQKIQNFEHFFFHRYGPVFLSHWIDSFKTVNNRDYDPSKDFPVLYNDLVAEYQAESAPIEDIRVQLREAIATQYRNGIAAHNAVGGWIDSLEKLNAAQRQAIDSLLAAIKPGLSLDSVDQAVETAKKKVGARIAELQK